MTNSDEISQVCIDYYYMFLLNIIIMINKCCFFSVVWYVILLDFCLICKSLIRFVLLQVWCASSSSCVVSRLYWVTVYTCFSYLISLLVHFHYCSLDSVKWQRLLTYLESKGMWLIRNNSVTFLVTLLLDSSVWFNMIFTQGSRRSGV